jgi:hypothetical protein
MAACRLSVPLALITRIIDREISGRKICRYLSFVYEDARGIARWFDNYRDRLIVDYGVIIRCGRIGSR